MIHNFPTSNKFPNIETNFISDLPNNILNSIILLINNHMHKEITKMSN
jgi:hypothetical protein